MGGLPDQQLFAERQAPLPLKSPVAASGKQGGQADQAKPASRMHKLLLRRQGDAMDRVEEPQGLGS